MSAVTPVMADKINSLNDGARRLIAKLASSSVSPAYVDAWRTKILKQLEEMQLEEHILQARQENAVSDFVLCWCPCFPLYKPL